MTSVKKIKVALLALVAALVIAIPTSAFAADGYTVTINNDKTGHTYGAYQVFKGDLSGSTLSNIAWGDDIDGTAALAAIKEINIGTAEQPNKPFAACTDAASVAKVLEGFPNGVADQYGNTDLFAATVAPFLKDIPDAQKCSAPVEGKYVISGLDAGYYLIRDTATVSGEDAATKFILQVVKDQPNITPKSSWPTSDKGIDEDDDVDAEGELVERYGKYGDYTIGQTIPYQLTGTLPDTYANYAEYYYVFHDKSSAGLDVDLTSVKAYLSTDNGVTLTAIDADLYTVAAETPADTENGKYPNGFKVEFDNLKDVVATYSATTKIVIKYNAVLNENCVVGNTGNPNKSYLEFNNDSNNSGKGKPTGDTPEDYAIAFTYELDNTKTGEGDDAAGLNDAKFILYRDRNAEVDDANAEADVDGKMYALVVNDKITGWTPVKANATKLTSKTVDDKKGRFDVIGLDQGKYYLEETDAPAGYNLLSAPIDFVITAAHAVDTTVGMEQINSLDIKVGNKAAVSGDPATGTVVQDISNTKGSVLPSTGGIGTTIFTIVGIALIVAAAAIMVIRRRNAAAIQ